MVFLTPAAEALLEPCEDRTNHKLTIFRLIFVSLTIFLLCGCTTLFFQPNRRHYPYIYLEKLRFSELKFASRDGTLLHAWYLPSDENRKAFPQLADSHQSTRALVVHFHGNAENLSSHYRALAWLNFVGFDVLCFDYRGYGQSAGSVSTVGIQEDVESAMEFAQNEARSKKLPLIFYGQSLGGSALLRALQDRPRISELKAVVIESSFYSYQQIAREKLKSTWLTWPFQWLAWILVTDRFQPGGKRLCQISPTPVLLIYSEEDPVVPIHHGRQLYADLAEPKQFWSHPYPGHINAMWTPDREFRRKLVAFLNSVL